MIVCSVCGAGVPENVKFCPECGSRMEEKNGGDTLAGFGSGTLMTNDNKPVSAEEYPLGQPYKQDEPPAVINKHHSQAEETTEQKSVQAARPAVPRQPAVQTGQPFQQAVITSGGMRIESVNRPVTVVPEPVTVKTKPPAPVDTVMGTASFLLLYILFTVPCIGFIMSIILSFAARNKNMRNFARAFMILGIVGIVLAVTAYFLLNVFLDSLLGGVFGVFQNELLRLVFDLVDVIIRNVW